LSKIEKSMAIGKSIAYSLVLKQIIFSLKLIIFSLLTIPDL
jgi:hypothetical protein